MDASIKVAVAVDKDKNSQNAFKWAIDNVVSRGQSLTLVHVNTKRSANGDESNSTITREILSSLRCLGIIKGVQCSSIILDEAEVAKAIIGFVVSNSVEKLVVGASPKGVLVRTFRGGTDISAAVFKGVPDFCRVYVISKSGKVTVRNAARPAALPLGSQVQAPTTTARPHPLGSRSRNGTKAPPEAAHYPWNLQKETKPIKSAFTRGAGYCYPTARSYGDIMLESDITFVNNHRPSVDRGYSPRLLSNISDLSESMLDTPAANRLPSFLRDEGTPSQHAEDFEAEIRKLRLEIKKTMDMYSTACKEALKAQEKAMDLENWKAEEEQKRLEEARLSEEEAALALAEKEKRRRAFHDMPQTRVWYRRYTIEEIETATENFAQHRKIGEGGYGPVYRCNLDHTPVAIKVLRPGAAQGRSQFQQEIEILCCIRHPNMVLLLGACPEYGCLVYEYMENGSLDDRLFRRGNTPPIPWQHWFRIAAEIGTGLLFLHQTKPEPLVHRDLKPANILLDRNYVSKIGDVGLARLVPPSVANSITQYRLTATAGTFCYIDPEYQQTGLLGVKSDIYSFGILLLQILTGKPPMGLPHLVREAIEKQMFAEILDKSVPDWPMEEALSLAELALMCAQLSRKDRPVLGTTIMPELDRLREFAEKDPKRSFFETGLFCTSPIHSQASTQVTRSGPGAVQSGTESSRSF